MGAQELEEKVLRGAQAPNPACHALLVIDTHRRSLDIYCVLVTLPLLLSIHNNIAVAGPGLS